MSGRRSRNKGANAERELRDVLKTYGVETNRTPNSGGLFLKGDLQGFDGWCVEAKRQERLNIHAALAQVEGDREPDERGFVAFRRSREPWHVALRLDHFMEALGYEVVDD